MARSARHTTFIAIALLIVLGASSAEPQAPVVAVLALTSPEQGAALWDQLFGGGLRALGYEPGQSVIIEYRWAHGDISRYPPLAADVLKRRPVVIVATCGPSLRAIREISPTVPVVAMCADEANFLGEVASLSRPGGYTTGTTFLAPETVGKRLELLKATIPRLSRLAVLENPDDPIHAHWRELERVRPAFGLTFHRIPVRRAEELEAAFQRMAGERVHAVFVFPFHLSIGQRTKIAELARRYRLPSVFEISLQVEAGGLMSYGLSNRELMGQSLPAYVDKILKGAKPGDLPILQPTRFELVVNQTTASVLGLKIPQSILSRADRVID